MFLSVIWHPAGYTKATLWKNKVLLFVSRMTHLEPVWEVEDPDLIYWSIPLLWLGRVTDFHTGFLAENKHVLSNTLWLWPPGLHFSLHTNGARTGSSARQSPVQALESRHLPRETSALHNVTLVEQRAVLDASEAPRYSKSGEENVAVLPSWSAEIRHHCDYRFVDFAVTQQMSHHQ